MCSGRGWTISRIPLRPLEHYSDAEVPVRYAGSLLIAFVVVANGCANVEGPTVLVTARYAGASAQVIADTVAAPIEQQIDGVEGMWRLESESCNDGTYTARVRFKAGVDSRAVLTLVENRVALAERVLPDAVQRTGLTVEAKAAAKAEDRVTIVLLDRGNVGWGALRRFSEAVRKRLSAEGAIVRPEILPGPGEKQAHVQIEREKCRAYNVPVAEVIKALDAARGKNGDELKSLTVRSAKGDTVVLGKLVTIELRSEPTAVYRIDAYPALRITGSPPPGENAKSASFKCAHIADGERSAQNRPADFSVMSGLY